MRVHLSDLGQALRQITGAGLQCYSRQMKIKGTRHGKHGQDRQGSSNRSHRRIRASRLVKDGLLIGTDSDSGRPSGQTQKG